MSGPSTPESNEPELSHHVEAEYSEMQLGLGQPLTESEQPKPPFSTGGGEKASKVRTKRREQKAFLSDKYAPGMSAEFAEKLVPAVMVFSAIIRSYMAHSAYMAEHRNRRRLRTRMTVLYLQQRLFSQEKGKVVVARKKGDKAKSSATAIAP